MKVAVAKPDQEIEIAVEKDAKVAGGKWRFEEATPITICAPANPTDPGDAADPSTPQGILSSSPDTHQDTHGRG
ncbi:MAG: hypothetical protein ACREDH_03965, partial [Methylocella sp.]